MSATPIDAPAPPAIAWQRVSVHADGHTILDDVSLDVPAGAWVSLIGPNGAGKTTLIRTIQHRDPVRGTVELHGRSITELSTRQRATLVAVVPQHPVIPPGTTVFDYVMLGRVPHQRLHQSPSIADRRLALAVLQRIGLDHFVDRRVDSLSGGERQRVVLARALTQDTPIVVLDEPTAALDVGHQLDVLELLSDIRTERELTVVTTVHDLTVAGQFADRIAVLAGGRLISDGRPAEVLTPEIIGDHWGVQARCDVDDDGAVTVTVQRRREAPPTHHAPTTDSVPEAVGPDQREDR